MKERRAEAIRTLAAVSPLGEVGSRQRDVTRRPRVQIVDSSLGNGALAYLGGWIVTAAAHDFAGTPTARLETRARLGALDAIVRPN